ncbi:MAG: hypothetical protein A2X52_02410 [Candidatus Rokubacteria bacterium GWC2_70_16]|nr:MAG: hypothetical protein A2X52_02410 [Candidatus Rokubacteria bacterium GWC2_70_16]
MLRSPGAAAVGAALLALLLLLPGLGAAPFDDPGEGQHAEIAREAWASGDWLTLRLGGIRYFDKPPLLYALGAAAFAAWGPSEWAARLGPVLGAAAAAAATALLGARLMAPAWGALAGAALLSCALFAFFGRYVRPETLFAAAIQWGLAGLLLGALRGAGARAWSLVGCAALGAAALAKDPLGLVGPLGAVGGALWLGGRLRPIGAWLPPAGLALALALGLGWYALAGLRNPGFLWYTVVDNHLLNAARLRLFPDEDVPLSALEFLATGCFGAFPWIVPAALMLVALARRRAWRDPGEMPWVALALWVAGTFAVVLAVPFRLPHYALPAYPAAALLAARWWRERARDGRGAVWLHLGLFALLACGLGLAASSDGRAFSDAVFGVSDVYTRKEAAAGQASPYPAWGALQPLVMRAALVFGAGSLGLLAAARLRSARVGLVVVTATMLALVPAVESAAARLAEARAVSGLAEEVKRLGRGGAVVVHEGPIENSGALEFYSGRRPILLDARRSVLGFGATFPEAAPTFWDGERFSREWLSDRALLLLTPRAPASSLVRSLPAGSARLLAARNGRWLYANAPATRLAAPLAPAGPSEVR